MNRKYSPEGFAAAVAALRIAFDNPAVTTDLIVGFPGETEKEFGETLEFIKNVGFAAMHIFPYSKRKGTKAADMPGQLTTGEKERRAAIAAESAAEMKRSYMEAQTGRVLHVLIEREKQGCGIGHTENYMETIVRGNTVRGVLAQVRITGNEDGRLIAVPERT
jgi:threonylcarbamoyladenosine tRNA methylthiotransferase MtaB